MANLSGKTAVVTGASRGLGRTIALGLAKEGAQVIVHYGRHAREADQVVSDIRAMGTRAEKVSADLSTPEGPQKLAKRAREIIGGRLDILAANADMFVPSSIEDLTIEGFDELFAVNVRAPLFLVQQLRPIMCTESNVIFISSPAGEAAMGSYPAYAATTGALESIVRHLAVSFGPHGIRVNAVIPNPSGGPQIPGKPEGVLEPEDIARVVAFLASDEARWITGETVRSASQL